MSQTIVTIDVGGTGANTAAGALISLGAAPAISFDQSNTAVVTANIANTQATVANTQANFARAQANAAFDAANTRVLKAGDTMTGNLNVAAVLITQNVIPDANVTYDLGSSTARYKDLWLSNSTIHLGEATISAQEGAVSFGNATVQMSNVISKLNVTNDLFVSGNVALGAVETTNLTAWSSNAAGGHFRHLNPGGWGVLRLDGISENASDLYVAAGGGSGSGAYFWNAGNTALFFGTNGAERLRITNGGNLSVGGDSITTPNGPAVLSLSKAEHAFYAQHRIGNSPGIGQEMFYMFNNSSNVPAAYSSIYTELGANTAGSHSGSMGLRVAINGTLTTALLINNNGNVGIGLTNPGAKLEVSGTEIRVRSANGARFQVFDDSSGNLGFRVRTATGGGWRWQFVDGSNGEYFGVDYTSGNTTIYGTLTELSSISLKENINPITNALETISMLVGVTYDRKDGTAIQRPGLIAEEVEKILPNVVIKDDAGTPSGISYTNLVAYLIESIKELKAEIDVLKSK